MDWLRILDCLESYQQEGIIEVQFRPQEGIELILDGLFRSTWNILSMMLSSLARCLFTYVIG